MTRHHLNRTVPDLFLMRIALVIPLAFPFTLHAWHPPGASQPFPRYTVEDLGTLGGPYSFSYSLNDAGIVTGGSATPAQNGDPSQAVVNAPQTAFFWDHGHLRNLGTLGGPNSAGAATNLFKVAAVDSETAQLSRQGADVCGFGTNRQCLAAVRTNGHLYPLPLLSGGNNSYALDMNDHGQVVGFSDTDVLDLDCAAARTAGFQFQSVVWEPNGHVRQLQPLAGDSVAFAFGVNNRGQTVGGSGVCANTTPPPYPGAPHAVLWERDGTAVDLGSFGGPVSIASAINSRGDVSGTSSTADGTPRPFLWTPKSRKLLILEPPAGFPIAINPCCKTINDRREIVGFMLDTNFNSRAFLWKNGLMVDLNDLIPKTSSWVLQSAAAINASGQIAGQGLIHGEVHAFLATPCHHHDGPRGECCENHDH